MAALLALVLLQVQDREPAARIILGGRMEPRYLYRDGRVNLAGGVLNGLADPESGSTNAWTGRFALRVTAEMDENLTGVLELENRSFDEGVNRPLSSNPEEDAVNVKLGYIDLRRFLSDDLDLRIGVQRLIFRNRPHDDAFFLDLGEGEGFFDGFSAASGQVRNTVDRDVREAAGMRLSWAPSDFMTVQAFWALHGEFGGTSEDESIYGIVANSLLSERASAWLLFTVASGGDPDLGQVGTLGAGYDGYFGSDRDLEVFVEAYGQRGTLQEHARPLRKEAWAGQAGLRWVSGAVWLEAAAAARSGDRHASDHVDQSFQSCENENRFLILESAEFGLDVDTNVHLVRAAAGLGPLQVSGKPLRFRLDVGRFTTPAAVRSTTGATLDARDWGVETDLSATWSYSAAFQMWLKGAWLAGSDLLDELTGRGESTHSILFGADFRF